MIHRGESVRGLWCWGGSRLLLPPPMLQECAYATLPVSCHHASSCLNHAVALIAARASAVLMPFLRRVSCHHFATALVLVLACCSSCCWSWRAELMPLSCRSSASRLSAARCAHPGGCFFWLGGERWWNAAAPLELLQNPCAEGFTALRMVQLAAETRQLASSQPVLLGTARRQCSCLASTVSVSGTAPW